MSDWRIMVPVKELAIAKTRTGLNQAERRALSLAMMRDVLAAARRIPKVAEVLICTSDPAILDESPRESIWFTTGGGLNSDIQEMLAEISGRDERTPTAVVMADLPCLRATDLSRLLDVAEQNHGAFVASLDGGTTALAAMDTRTLMPKFGRDSAAEHRRWYHDASNDVGVGCRLDVDTVDALAWAHRIGVGAQTGYWVTARGGPESILRRGLVKRHQAPDRHYALRAHPNRDLGVSSPSRSGSDSWVAQ